eukprot:1457666-Prymnesium_polylepis.2
MWMDGSALAPRGLALHSQTWVVGLLPRFTCQIVVGPTVPNAFLTHDAHLRALSFDRLVRY